MTCSGPSAPRSFARRFGHRTPTRSLNAGSGRSVGSASTTCSLLAPVILHASSTVTSSTTTPIGRTEASGCDHPSQHSGPPRPIRRARGTSFAVICLAGSSTNTTWSRDVIDFWNPTGPPPRRSARRQDETSRSPPRPPRTRTHPDPQTAHRGRRRSTPTHRRGRPVAGTPSDAPPPASPPAAVTAIRCPPPARPATGAANNVRPRFTRRLQRSPRCPVSTLRGRPAGR